MSTDIPTCETELECPRCGTKNVDTNHDHLAGTYSYLCFVEGCTLESPPFFTEAEALDWWTKPFARPARDAALREALTNCIEAIETLGPLVFGMGTSSDGERHWYIRDELIARSTVALNQTEDKTDGVQN